MVKFFEYCFNYLNTIPQIGCMRVNRPFGVFISIKNNLRVSDHTRVSSFFSKLTRGMARFHFRFLSSGS